MQISPICILDDDASVLRSICRLLESEGLSVKSFQDANEFLAHARSYRIELAILDVCLREANGIEVQSRLREISPETSVIIMTGRDLPGLQSAALNNGARAFVLKPFDGESFLTKVQEALPATHV
jgi:FixJ family two-component response regulator